MLYMPPGNVEAMVHYEDTIQRRVPLSRIERFVSPTLRNRLVTFFGNHPIAIWGSRAGPQNQTRFELMSEGDDVLIVVDDSIKLIGKIAAKTISPDLSRALWQPLVGGLQAEPWELIYFIADAREIDLPFGAIRRLFGYADGYTLRGFSTISDEKLDEFYSNYDDLYSILVRIKAGDIVEKRRKTEESRDQYELDLVDSPTPFPDKQAEAPSEVASDHTRMQYMLARLGQKAGERIWVPPADQTRILSSYEFQGFDRTFTTAIDLPKSYVENIDVVWKQEYRVDAAYEVENSTAIYSGLLRFADLSIMVPNSTYPMFIVAPSERRGKVRDQLARPSFRELGLHKRFRFLPYEAVDDIDRFFAATEAGLTVELVKSKSELLTTE